MVQTTSSHSIAPAAVLRGEGAWAESLPQIKALCSWPLVLGRSSATAELRQHLTADLESVGLAPTDAQLHFDCCELDLARLHQHVDSVFFCTGMPIVSFVILLSFCFFKI